MKLHHFIIVFVIVMLAVIVLLDIRTDNFKAVASNKEQIDKNLDTALDDGAANLVEVDQRKNIIVNKDAAVKSFFLSLDSAFGLMADKKGQEKLNQYIPVITVTTEDGYYVFYSDEYAGSDGYTYVAKRWSEKFPYYYEDDDFIYGFTLGDILTLYDKTGILGEASAIINLDYHDLINNPEYAFFRAERPDSFLLDPDSFELIRKGKIADYIEKTLGYYTSRHNKIAAEYGITYNFALPGINDNEWAKYLDDVSMFVVFQGYPYGSQTGEFYNRFASAGAKVSKKEEYYVEQKGWYRVYHRASCPEQNKDGLLFTDEPFYNVEACVSLGAYACPECIPNGIYAPDINRTR